jgi:cbb3-type cytochrome oxidase maturation protein
MEIIYLLIPLSLVLIGLIVWAFFWAVRSGQFDDLEGPAHRILMDDDAPASKPPDEASDKDV